TANLQGVTALACSLRLRKDAMTPNGDNPNTSRGHHRDGLLQFANHRRRLTSKGIARGDCWLGGKNSRHRGKFRTYEKRTDDGIFLDRPVDRGLRRRARNGIVAGGG